MTKKEIEQATFVVIDHWMTIAKDIKKEFHYRKDTGQWYWADRGEEHPDDWHGPFPNFCDCLYAAVEPYVEKHHEPIRIVVTLNAEPCEPETDFTREELQAVTLAAITNAVKHGENQGFSHDLDEHVSIQVASIELEKDN